MWARAIARLDASTQTFSCMYSVWFGSFHVLPGYAPMENVDPQGRSADCPLAIPLSGWWAILKRTYAQASQDNLGLIAAGVAFYGFLALVPLLGALVLTYGLVVDPAAIDQQFRQLAPALPADVAKLVGEQLASLIATSAEKKGLGLAAALGLAVYGAMKGAGAIVTALNIAFEETEKRGFVASNLISAALTLGAVALAIILIVAAAVAQTLEHAASGLPTIAIVAIKLAGYMVAAGLAIFALSALYRYAPSRAHARWRWLTPGSISATVGLLAASSAFAWYAANFGNYNATYGSLGAVVVLLMWLYLSAYVLLLGAELNAEIEHQTAVDTTTGAPLPLGERAAVMADEVAD